MDTPASDEIPPPVLDQAIMWAVRLQSGTADTAIRSACAAWRAADPLHERAWQELQQIEQTFRDMPPTTTQLASRTLETAQYHRGIHKGRRRVLKLLGASGISAAVGWFITEQFPWHYWMMKLAADYATAKGEHRTIDLSDGSQLILNTATLVDVEFTSSDRLIRLQQGEIFIRTGSKSSPHTDHRSLQVITRESHLRAIGTRFFVRQEENQTRLHVEEGAVAITTENSSQPVIAHPGQKYVIDMNDATLATDNSFDTTGWVNGVLIASEMRLADFLTELSRYREGWLHCDPAVANLLVSGVFQLDDIDHVLEAVTRTLPVKISRRTRYWVTVTPIQ